MTDSMKLNHCNLPTESLAVCDKLREIPSTDGQDIICLCCKETDDECIYAVEITHQFPGVSTEQQRD